MMHHRAGLRLSCIKRTRCFFENRSWHASQLC